MAYSKGLPGPLFFLLYIDDLYRFIGCNNDRLYADDTVIIIKSHDLIMRTGEGSVYKTLQLVYC